jgi:hypothetical protein
VQREDRAHITKAQPIGTKSISDGRKHGSLFEMNARTEVSGVTPGSRKAKHSSEECRIGKVVKFGSRSLSS